LRDKGLARRNIGFANHQKVYPKRNKDFAEK
jgi:hypothetical protein